MASPIPEAWAKAQPASDLHSTSFVVSGSVRLLLESCRQQACRQLSVEILGAAPSLWPGLPSSPQWAQDLDSQQAPRPRLSANSNRLLAGPRQGGLSGKSSSLYLTTLRGQWWGVPFLPSLGSTHAISQCLPHGYFFNRSTMLIMIYQPGKGQTPWPSCLYWRKNCSQCW